MLGRVDSYGYHFNNYSSRVICDEGGVGQTWFEMNLRMNIKYLIRFPPSSIPKVGTETIHFVLKKLDPTEISLFLADWSTNIKN